MKFHAFKFCPCRKVFVISFHVLNRYVTYAEKFFPQNIFCFYNYHILLSMKKISAKKDKKKNPKKSFMNFLNFSLLKKYLIFQKMAIK
jgi:hypothetical protein